MKLELTATVEDHNRKLRSSVYLQEDGKMSVIRTPLFPTIGNRDNVEAFYDLHFSEVASIVFPTTVTD